MKIFNLNNLIGSCYLMVSILGVAALIGNAPLHMILFILINSAIGFGILLRKKNAEKVSFFISAIIFGYILTSSFYPSVALNFPTYIVIASFFFFIANLLIVVDLKRMNLKI